MSTRCQQTHSTRYRATQIQPSPQWRPCSSRANLNVFSKLLQSTCLAMRPSGTRGQDQEQPWHACSVKLWVACVNGRGAMLFAAGQFVWHDESATIRWDDVNNWIPSDHFSAPLITLTAVYVACGQPSRLCAFSDPQASAGLAGPCGQTTCWPRNR